MKLATIGFTQSSAEHFFGRLLAAEVARLIDVRLHNVSQLGGFAKAEDLRYFLRALGGIDYAHEPLLAPDDALFTFYRRDKGDWSAFEQRFLELMATRRIEERYSPDFFERGCLLCSEPTAHRCHRRLVCDYLNERWGGRLEVRHL